MAYNTPDDWDRYWETCKRCGGRYHASEGACDCYTYAMERNQADFAQRLVKLNESDKDKLLTQIWEVLWPEGDAYAQWSPDTPSDISSVFSEADLEPKED